MTSEQPLQGKRILVVEDDFYLASDEADLLKQAGATVVGPLGAACSEQDIASAGPLDGAVVDINLGSGPNFALARVLTSHGVPFAFVTGYDADVVPEEFAGAPRLEKPIRGRDLIAAVAELTAARD